MNDKLIVEREAPPARLAELGVHGWPTWKDGVGSRVLQSDAAEKSYLLDGVVTLTANGGEPVTARKGDLVIIPAGECLWEVSQAVRRHYRSDALSPACCIV
jgi:uncharacterized cupin superfamily protein